MSVFVDTSALFALLDEDDTWHSQAEAAFRALAATTELVTTNYVQVEAVALARGRLGRAAVVKLTDAIFPALTTLWVDEATHSAAMASHAGGGRASFVDQVSFLTMRQHGIDEALAFDRDFEVEGFRLATARSGGQKRVHESEATYGSAADSPDLVSVTEISRRAMRPVNTIQSWRRRHRDFPKPVAQLAAGPIWYWPAIETWIATRGRRTDRGMAVARVD